MRKTSNFVYGGWNPSEGTIFFILKTFIMSTTLIVAGILIFIIGIILSFFIPRGLEYKIIFYMNQYTIQKRYLVGWNFISISGKGEIIREKETFNSQYYAEKELERHLRYIEMKRTPPVLVKHLKYKPNIKIEEDKLADELRKLEIGSDKEVIILEKLRELNYIK